MPRFQLLVTWANSALVEVTAESEDDAIQQVVDEENLPENGGYVADSFQVCSCELLPDLPAEPITVPLETAQACLRMILSDLDMVFMLCDDTEEYLFERLIERTKDGSVALIPNED